MRATVGLSKGDIDQYYVGISAGDRCPLMPTLSPSNWYFVPEDVGAAIVVGWTQDGGALVVGWERKGLAVWSVSGFRLMWTLPQVRGTVPTAPALRKERHSVEHPMEQGVLAACWDPQGLYLWAAHRVTSQPPPNVQERHFVGLNLHKATFRATSVQNDSSRLALFGTDRVLLLWHTQGDGASTPPFYPHAMSSDFFFWQHLIIPYDYSWHNWPPKYVAINADASYAAVDGEHGVAVRQVRMQRWKVFGEVANDRCIRCCASAWVRRTIVMGNEVINSSSKSYELLFYPRDQVEASALQAQKTLPSKPLLTDVRGDGYLLVVYEDAEVLCSKLWKNDHALICGKFTKYFSQLGRQDQSTNKTNNRPQHPLERMLLSFFHLLQEVVSVKPEFSLPFSMHDQATIRKHPLRRTLCSYEQRAL